MDPTKNHATTETGGSRKESYQYRYDIITAGYSTPLAAIVTAPFVSLGPSTTSQCPKSKKYKRKRLNVRQYTPIVRSSLKLHGAFPVVRHSSTCISSFLHCLSLFILSQLCQRTRIALCSQKAQRRASMFSFTPCLHRYYILSDNLLQCHCKKEIGIGRNVRR